MFGVWAPPSWHATCMGSRIPPRLPGDPGVPGQGRQRRVVVSNSAQVLRCPLILRQEAGFFSPSFSPALLPGGLPRHNLLTDRT